MSIGTMLTAAILLGIVAAVILKIRRDRKRDPCDGCSRCRESDCC